MNNNSIVNCKNVLIIEDDQDIRESIKDALEMEGYTVTVATNGKEGLDSLKNNAQSCIILLDMIMPLMGGREFLDIIKKDLNLSLIPVFIHSAVANKNNTEGSVGFIKKPADLEEILNVVKNYCCMTSDTLILK